MFEITETGLISAPASSLENLVRLRIMGCGLAMDDFGAGYSSLDRLCEFPFSQIKLDRTFVQKMKTQPRSCAVISSVVALAQALGISWWWKGGERRTTGTPDRTRLLHSPGLPVRPADAGTALLDYCSGS